LEKEYGQGEGIVRALDGVELEVASGETLAVMGPSGCGKSTLLHLLGGLERPSAGEVWLTGRRIDELACAESASTHSDRISAPDQAARPPRRPAPRIRSRSVKVKFVRLRAPTHRRLGKEATRMPIIKRDQLPWNEIAHELVGAEHGLGITLLFVDAEPGRGPALHRHPYTEVIIVQEGEAALTLDGTQHEARAGDIVVVLPNQAHAFVNSGGGPLRQIDIHLSASFSTEWLEDRDKQGDD
jgi:quercetin dioxygenase-like cupin family protein